MRRSVYCDPEAWCERREAVEAEWPEYRDSTLALSRPKYQSDASLSPEQWLRRFLVEDVEELQQHKQHHVHLPRAPGGPRLPLAHCRDAKDPSRCKAGFPRHDCQLLDTTVLLCSGLAQRLGLPVKGKRSALGSLWGPINDPNLNGTHPALLAALRCNSDVQVPYRFPITPELHDGRHCDQDCPASRKTRDVVREAQVNQAAQAGYGADYQNKRLPIAVHEIKEWQKSQQGLAKDLEDKPAGYAMSRVAKRLATDCCVRGVCRGSVECTNLVDQSQHKDPARAESIRTAQVADLSLLSGLKLLDAASADLPLPEEGRRLRADPRRTGTGGTRSKTRSITCPPLTLYGERGRDVRVHQLSMYEFKRYYDHQVALHPWSVEQQQSRPEAFHARLTEAGCAAVLSGVSKSKLLPGDDYQIREEGDVSWIPLGTGARAQPYRHDWVTVPRNRPHVPVLYGAQGSRTEEDQAKKILLLFCPWTSNPADATDDVPYVGALRPSGGHITWRQALGAWIDRRGLPTEEVKRYVLNFCFVYCLPRKLQSDGDLVSNSDNEGLEDPEWAGRACVRERVWREEAISLYIYIYIYTHIDYIYI